MVWKKINSEEINGRKTYTFGLTEYKFKTI